MGLKKISLPINKIYTGAIPEHRFHPLRKWRFDWAWPDQMLALEIEGGVWVGGRHTSGAGFVKDMEKYNAATLLGWRILRVTPSQMKNGEAYDLIDQALGRIPENDNRIQ